MGDAHDHGGRDVQTRALWVALGLNAGFLGVEVVGGLVFNSLALLADAAHMLSDVVGLGIALYAQRLMERPASVRHTYGFQRAEVLGALANAATLAAVVAWIAYEAIRRLSDPEAISGGGVLLVAAAGLLVNAVSALILYRARGRSLNMRGAVIHMASDAAGSVVVVVTGLSVLLWGLAWVDPVASLVVALLVAAGTWGLLRDTVHVLMEGAPRGMDPREVESVLADQPGVSSVHHVHLWNLASDVPALSAHVVLGSEESLHDAQVRGQLLKAVLQERFGIEHATLELECHPCEAEPAAGGHGPPA